MDKSKMAKADQVVHYDLLKEDYKNEDMSRPVKQRMSHSFCDCMCLECDCRKSDVSIDVALSE